ncbi:uncharacterized protein METZ01_LOCUS186931 [marine metagenome]|uniref:Uncharacterized protein n=1 Tax=marine metagenome TaxID=408172 RepID=A0A382D8W6_9ZZZZ
MSSIFEEEWEDYELDSYQFEQWLDSINDSGDPEKDQEYYDKEMAKQAEYPEVVVQSSKYTMTYSNN